ncbi:hypothetical protein [Methylophaga sp.]|uniref:hypothetical protein n=1 Tax=Methylophaga sp. TaxID=2024840 RepID=UPI003A900984
MSQHDYVISNAVGAPVRADINSVLDAIKTNNSGTTAPSPTSPYMWWADTNAEFMKQRNAANTAWISLYPFGSPLLSSGNNLSDLEDLPEAKTNLGITDIETELAQAYNPDNIVGTVSQTGGDPTGAIIERGTNANGDYIRFADGTQVCWYQVATTNSVAANDSEAGSWTFPAEFIAIPVVSPKAGGALGSRLINLVETGATTSTANWVAQNLSASSQSYSARYVAHGRWY